MGVLNQDGVCAPFDKKAMGFTRSDAAVAILLQKAEDAKRIYARIIHSVADHDGFKTEGFSFPSANGQINLYSKFYKDINFNPHDVSYLETHSTATIGNFVHLFFFYYSLIDFKFISWRS